MSKKKIETGTKNGDFVRPLAKEAGNGPNSERKGFRPVTIVAGRV